MQNFYNLIYLLLACLQWQGFLKSQKLSNQLGEFNYTRNIIGSTLSDQINIANRVAKQLSPLYELFKTMNEVKLPYAEIDTIDETFLEKNNLIDSDVYSYVGRAWQLQENIENLTDTLIVDNGK